MRPDDGGVGVGCVQDGRPGVVGGSARPAMIQISSCPGVVLVLSGTARVGVQDAVQGLVGNRIPSPIRIQPAGHLEGDAGGMVKDDLARLVTTSETDKVRPSSSWLQGDEE
jgi:hypothetical protein